MNRVPLIIVARDGSIVDVAYVNEKAAAKSTERGEIWYCHADTDRVLPWRGGVAFESFQRRESDSLGRWFVVSVDSARADGALPAAGAADTAEDRTHPTTSAPREPSDEAADALGNAGEILAGLQATIRRRRREMPEGSYTTHLFSKGAEKIRKKTGEEAVELILARDAAELRSEAADLLYHLMVLLEVEDDSIGSVLAALRDRF